MPFNFALEFGLLLIFLIISGKNLLLWLYLWQLKEYRGDKMLDYLYLPESRPIVFNAWTWLRVFYLGVFSFFGILSIFFDYPYPTNLFAWLYLVFILEVVEVVLRLVLKKQIRMPVFSNKAKLQALLSGSTILAILPIYIYFYEKTLWPIYLVFITLVIPLIVGYWLLVMFPIDYLVKENLFAKARKHRDKFKKLEVIAVSGAYGKTSVKEMLNTFLSLDGETIRNLKNENSNVSCARWTLKLTDKFKYFVCELGAYKRGDGSEICKFIHPTAAIITGLNLQHYSLFGSEEKIILAESESLNFLGKNSVAAVNWSSKMLRKIDFPKSLKLIKYGYVDLEKDAKDYDIYATQMEFKAGKTSFNLHYQKTKTIVKTNLYSKGNVENLVGALALALHYGIALEDLVKACGTLTSPAGSLQVTEKSWGLQIDDGYNTNFDGVVNALRLLASLKSGEIKKAVAVVDDILELGEKSEEIHLALAEEINKLDIDELVLTGRNFANLIAERLIELNFTGKLILGQQVKNYKLPISKYSKTSDLSKVAILFEGKQSAKLIP